MTRADWFPGSVHAEVVLAVALLGAAYALALRAGGAAPGRGRPARFAGGLLALLLTLNGPLHDLADDYLFSAHMVQHLVLTLVVPPLLLAGTPAWMLDALVAAADAGIALGRRATRPLPAFALYGVALIVWHLPRPYGAALDAHPVHVVQHLTLLATATLGWWPVVASSTLAPRLPYAAQILYLFAFGIPMTVVAALVTGADEVLYPHYATAPPLFGLTPLADQKLGGVIMWVPAGLIPLAAFTVVFFRWASAEAEEPAES